VKKSLEVQERNYFGVFFISIKIYFINPFILLLLLLLLFLLLLLLLLLALIGKTEAEAAQWQRRSFSLFHDFTFQNSFGLEGKGIFLKRTKPKDQDAFHLEL